jgi:myosin heavy chain 6/7
MQADLDEMSNEVKSAEEKSKKAALDVQRMTDEVRSEKEHSASIEKMRHALESQVKELNLRLDEAEASALKGGKKLIAKLESRVSI